MKPTAHREERPHRVRHRRKVARHAALAVLERRVGASLQEQMYDLAVLLRCGGVQRGAARGVAVAHVRIARRLHEQPHDAVVAPDRRRAQRRDAVRTECVEVGLVQVDEKGDSGLLAAGARLAQARAVIGMAEAACAD